MRVAHEPIDAEYQVKGEGAATEPLRQSLAQALEADPLYAKLQELRWADKVLPLEILGQLVSGMMYSTPQLPDLIGAGDVPESTIRTWVDRFRDYVQPVRDGRNFRFPVPAVVRVRILYLFIHMLKWNFATVRNVLAGLVEESDVVEEAGQGEFREVISTLQGLVPGAGDFRATDPRVVALIGMLVDLEASAAAGRLILSQDALPVEIKEKVARVPHLEEQNRQLQEALAAARQEVATFKSSQGDLQARLSTAEGQVATIPMQELQQLLERQRKGFWSRLFGR